MTEGAGLSRVIHQIGKFQLRKVLGKGASGTVYLALDTFSGEDVALKVLDPEADFGAAYFHKAQETQIADIGSPLYMSPEQISSGIQRRLRCRAEPDHCASACFMRGGGRRLPHGAILTPVMLRAIRRLFEPAQGETPSVSGYEHRQLQVAVAVLLHEARRADYVEGDEETVTAELALVELFGLERRESAELLEQGRARAQQLTSFYAPVTVVKREFSLPERIRLVEHLWRITFADGRLNLYEDHYVRKIAHLLYVPNTENMLARNRARA